MNKENKVEEPDEWKLGNQALTRNELELIADMWINCADVKFFIKKVKEDMENWSDGDRILSTHNQKVVLDIINKRAGEL